MEIGKEGWKWEGRVEMGREGRGGNGKGGVEMGREGGEGEGRGGDGEGGVHGDGKRGVDYLEVSGLLAISSNS